MFRRPVSHIITPVLGTAAVGTFVFGQDPYNGKTILGSIGEMQTDLNQGSQDLALALQGNAVSPTFISLAISTALAGIAGRIFKV